MPFKSEAQRRFMHINHPEIAKRWEHKYGSKPMGGKDRMPNPNANMHALQNALNKSKMNRGRRVGRNMTPGIPRRIGQRVSTTRMNPRQMIAKTTRMANTTEETPPVTPRPAKPPSDMYSTKQPRGRLNTLLDKKKGNNRKAMVPLLRMYSRALQGKGFGRYVFGENQGNTTQDFLKAIRPTTKGTGLYRMFNQQIQSQKPKPKPMPLPEPIPTEGSEESSVAAKIKKIKSNRGRRVGRNMTPGVPRRVGSRY